MKRMLINVASPEESRVAIVESSGRGKRHDLMEIYVERTSSETILGNIYKGRVIRVEPSIQAAFVDCGVSQNGFLHHSDVMPVYGKASGNGNGNGRRKGGNGKGGKGKGGKGRRSAIEDLLQQGQEVLVRVNKEAIGDKGPSLTTYLSLPGRGVVLMPSLTDRVRVSSKIESQGRRGRLRKMVQDLDPPSGVGYIVRTAAEDMTPEELDNELRYMLEQWAKICRETRIPGAPRMIYAESDIVIRTLRDLYTPDIEEVIVDDEQAYQRALGYFKVMCPRWVDRIKLHEKEVEPLYITYGVEHQIDQIYDNKVKLPSGGSIVMDQTEALVAIDVNSGRNTKGDDIEETALETNLEAVKEAAAQLRLRDLGGVIVIDLIDMRETDNRRKVERKLGELLDKDRARTKMSRISQFGIIEMTRQRVGPPLRRYTHEHCPTCSGTGWVRNLESMALLTVRRIHLGLRDKRIQTIAITANPQLLGKLAAERSDELSQLQEHTGKTIQLKPDDSRALNDIDVHYSSETGQKVTLQRR